MSKELSNKRQELEMARARLKELARDLDIFEPDVDELDYDEWLDELYEPYECGVTIYASDALKNCDPIAYRCGFNDYINSLDPEDFEEYRDIKEEIDELESDIFDLEQEIEELEAE